MPVHPISITMRSKHPQSNYYGAPAGLNSPPFLFNGRGASMGPSIHGDDSGCRRAFDPLRLAAERTVEKKMARDFESRNTAAFQRHAEEQRRAAKRQEAQFMHSAARAAREVRREVREDSAWDAFADAKFDEELHAWRVGTLIEQDEARFAAAERERIAAPRGVRAYHDLDTVMGPTPPHCATNPEEAYEAMSAQLDALETREHDLQRIMERCLETDKPSTLFGIPPLKEDVSIAELDSLRLPVRVIAEYARESMGGHNSYNSRPYMGRDSVAQSEMNQELFERASVIAATADALAASIDHDFEKAAREVYIANLGPKPKVSDLK